MPAAQVSNILIRALTLGSRFLLVVFLARFLRPEDVGLYGLVVATITVAVMAVGLDFYTYSSRELLGTDRQEWNKRLSDQAVLHALTYLIALPALLTLFVWGLLPWSVWVWFLLLLILEHVGRELNRLLIISDRPLYAGGVLFLQRGIWAAVVPLSMWLWPAARSLNVVFGSWTACASIAVLAGAHGVRPYLPTTLPKTVDWAWLRTGVRVGLTFLVGTLSLKVLFAVDRYAVRALDGEAILGVYTLFASVAMSAMAFLDAGVFAFTFPALVRAGRSGDLGGVSDGVTRMLSQTVSVTVVLASALALGMPILVRLLPDPVYAANIHLFWGLLIMVMVYALGMVPHFGLYALSEDRAILLSQIGGLLVFVGALAVFRTMGSLGVVVSLVIGLSAVGIAKFLVYRGADLGGGTFAKG